MQTVTLAGIKLESSPHPDGSVFVVVHGTTGMQELRLSHLEWSKLQLLEGALAAAAGRIAEVQVQAQQRNNEEIARVQKQRDELRAQADTMLALNDEQQKEIDRRIAELEAKQAAFREAAR